MPPVAAAIAAVAASIGVSAGALTAALIGILSQVVSMGLAALLRSKPDKPSISGRRQQMQSTVRDPVKPRELIIGKMQKGGTIAFIDTVDNESVLLMAVMFAGHEVTGIDEIYFFDELAIDQNGVIQEKFKNLVQYEKFLGTSDQAASSLLINNSPLWTVNHRLRGIAYIALRFEFDREVFNQIPNVTARIRGAKVFDPRDSLTKYSPNAALGFAHYLSANCFMGLKAAYGTDIDSDMLIAAANECDEDVPIKAGKVLEFDGDGDLINLGDILDQTGSFSVEARIRLNELGMDFKILTKDTATAGWSLYIDQTRVGFTTRGLSNVTLHTPAMTIGVGPWYQVAAVWNSSAGTLTIYVNGAQAAQATGITGSLTANSQPMAIGTNFNGRIQDVRLWSVARSSVEINAFRDKTLTGQEANLVGYWKLDEKRGDRVEDATETGNDAFITGAIWVDDDSVIGTEKRFPMNGVAFSDQVPRELIEEMLTAMGGTSVFSGGRWLIRAAAYEPPTVLLDENDAIEPLRIQPRRSKRELFNAVRGTLLTPENQYQPTDFPLITVPGFEAQDGGERIVQDIELPYTTSASAAQRLAFLHLLRNREQVTCHYVTNLKGMRLRGGDFCEVTNTRMGWSAKDFEIMSWNLSRIEDPDGNPGLGVPLDLRETNPTIYDFNPATDEVPLNPSPDTSLPSPFGRIALIADFVDRTGFESISEIPNAGTWLGGALGFVRNPWTGHLNVEDQLSAAGDNFDVFDEYVLLPVVKGAYESPEIDIEFSDIVRTYLIATFFKGAGEGERIVTKRYYDSREEGEAYTGWKSFTKPVRAEGRYFKHKIEINFHAGAGGYLGGFTPVVDKMTLRQKDNGVIVPVGGKTIDFPERYHNIPSMSAAVQGGVRMVDFTAINKTDFTVLLFDQNAADAGGVMDWQAVGV